MNFHNVWDEICYVHMELCDMGMRMSTRLRHAEYRRLLKAWHEANASKHKTPCVIHLMEGSKAGRVKLQGLEMQIKWHVYKERLLWGNMAKSLLGTFSL